MGRGRRQERMPGSSKRLRWFDTVSSPLVGCDDDDDDDDDCESIDVDCC